MVCGVAEHVALSCVIGPLPKMASGTGQLPPLVRVGAIFSGCGVLKRKEGRLGGDRDYASDGVGWLSTAVANI